MNQEQQKEQKPVTYGDMFSVSGELAKKPVAPQDAAMMQAAEATVFGGTQKGGTAAAMQKAAGVNERCGFVGRDDVTMDGGHGVTVTATELPGARVVTETVDGQVCIFLSLELFYSKWPRDPVIMRGCGFTPRD
ncbi:late embryogenesis abundant protein D-34-like protein [Tanacetum coccineum]